MDFRTVNKRSGVTVMGEFFLRSKKSISLVLFLILAVNQMVMSPLSALATEPSGVEQSEESLVLETKEDTGTEGSRESIPSAQSGETKSEDTDVTFPEVTEPDTSVNLQNLETEPESSGNFFPAESSTETELSNTSENVLEIGGKIICLGENDFAVGDLNIILSVNKIPDETIKPEIEKRDGKCFYRFRDLPVSDENGQPYTYGVLDKDLAGSVTLTLTDETKALFYRQNNRLVKQDSQDAASPIDLVYVGLDDLQGFCREEFTGDDAPVWETSLDVSVKENADSAFLSSVNAVSLKAGDTEWSIPKLLLYNPLTEKKIEYRVAASSLEGHVISYENIAPYSDKTDYAYQGGTIVVAPALLLAMPFGLLSMESFTPGAGISFTAELNWNDNSAEDRPLPALKIYYKIPGLGTTEFAELSEAILLDWGMNAGDVDLSLPALTG